jgi:choline dehydrogenase-like flavoprotein
VSISLARELHRGGRYVVVLAFYRLTVALRVDEKIEGTGELQWGGLKEALLARSEQAPNRDGCVVFGLESDCGHRRRPCLRWVPTAGDRRRLVRSMELIVDALRSAHGADVELAIQAVHPWPWEPGGPVTSALHSGGNHHMCATCVSSDAEESVVDANCRVHRLENLFVAGSSVFPTSGFANPTFTPATLAIRLVYQLLAVMGDRKSVPAAGLAGSPPVSQRCSLEPSP